MLTKTFPSYHPRVTSELINSVFRQRSVVPHWFLSVWAQVRITCHMCTVVELQREWIHLSVNAFHTSTEHGVCPAIPVLPASDRNPVDLLAICDVVLFLILCQDKSLFAIFGHYVYVSDKCFSLPVLFYQLFWEWSCEARTGLAAAWQQRIHHILLYFCLMSLLVLICTSPAIATACLCLTELSNEVSATGTHQLPHDGSSRDLGGVLQIASLVT